VKLCGDRAHAMKEIAWNTLHLQSEEIANLRACNENGNAVCESHDNRSGKVFHHRPQAGHAHHDQ
jgi:hypothetical protein